MSSRNAILHAIRQNKPAPAALPEIPRFPQAEGDFVSRFKMALEAIGVRVIDQGNSVADMVIESYPEANVVCSAIPAQVAGTLWLDEIDDPHDLAGVDVFVCEGTLGVAENGAIWVTESQMGHRAAPFITQHLAIVLDKQNIVATLHDAYARTQVNEDGYGAFIAGPSKTADIEQSLVIGAHGPRSLTVLLI